MGSGHFSPTDIPRYGRDRFTDASRKKSAYRLAALDPALALSLNERNRGSAIIMRTNSAVSTLGASLTSSSLANIGSKRRKPSEVSCTIGDHASNEQMAAFEPRCVGNQRRLCCREQTKASHAPCQVRGDGIWGGFASAFAASTLATASSISACRATSSTGSSASSRQSGSSSR
jgi:hypothetical protein